VIELNGRRIEGEVAVREFHRRFGFAGEEGSFSDVRVEERHRHRTQEAIVVEQTLHARHTRTWKDVPATGRTISIPVCTVYAFAGGRLARESVYLDEERIRRELTRSTAEGPFRSTRDIIVRTPDLEAAAKFYRESMGFPGSLNEANIVGFETGALQLFVERGTPAHAPVFEMLVEDVRAAKERLVAAGCVVVEEDPRLPRCYVRDAWGVVFNVAARRE
jgi:hypothetical protein